MNLSLSAAAAYRSFDAVALNPQPLPPKALSQVAGRFDAVALNPQPLPPKETASPQLLADVDAVALNPQPLPPKEIGIASLLRKLDWASLNPQPLPPKATTSPSLFSSLDAVAFNPQPDPPRPGDKASLFRAFHSIEPSFGRAAELKKESNNLQIAVNKAEQAAVQHDDTKKSSSDHAKAIKEAIMKMLDIARQTNPAI